MLSEIVAELGTEIRNQQDTVKTPLAEVKLPLGSLVTWMLALLVKVAATERKPNNKITNPAKSVADAFGRRVCVVFVGENISNPLRHLFHVVASHNAISLSLTHQQNLRTNACTFHFEGNAIVGIYARLLTPIGVFIREN